MSRLRHPADRRAPALRAGRIVALGLAVLLGGCAAVAPRGGPPDPCAVEPAGVEAAEPSRAIAALPGAPEVATGYVRKPLVRAASYVAVTAHPLATRTACQVLAGGGSAADAAIAAQWVLAVVEPQSSGLGGGGFLLHWDAARRAVTAWDGRETAPAASTPDDLRWIGADERVPPRPNARDSGRSVGVPGLVHLLAAHHAEHGRRPWRELLAPAIALADEGFAVSPRLAASIAASADALARDAHARAVFLHADGRPLAAGDRLVQRALAATLRTLADEGADAFYRGAIARDIVDAVADTRGGTVTPGRLTLADLAAYRSVRRDALCVPYRAHVVCGMPPPSSGGLAVAQALGVLEAFDLAALRPSAVDADGGRPDASGVHLVTEALRLAFADRNRYVADTDFVPLPGTGVASLLDRDYLRRRAALIDPARSIGTAPPGEFGAPAPGRDAGAPRGGTTHLTVVDRDGNAVVLTSSIESAFGSRRMTRGGVLLNNQLTDFAPAPVDAQGRPLANRLEPGKRPRSSMAPTLVFTPDARGRPATFAMATGSPGGATIIAHVLKSLVGVLDWGLDAQQAAALVAVAAFDGPTTIVGAEHPLVEARDGGAADPLVAALRSRGHDVRLAAQSSGLAIVVRRCDAARCVYEAGADPRREGVARGR
ncbi:gamma-glutamyltransferase family protein [Calidifontimicrobium sp. SYSU G02091]|uniref:gamma-glutamyltransferase family protein n=1 Tax=Calidifontimicrobium sp. SYSU G02091 TaxID=2926421 RepID=UPI001F537EF6|nr:gamma-glutamyltransferase family protein [Calidifontimicrobium sp. SYSU G02091]MCI1192229.1 gamma-glutamyltransferase family protein [Calidifontimicrobium sp. SYSU G02091]